MLEEEFDPFQTMEEEKMAETEREIVRAKAKNHSIDELLTEGQEVLVQVAKEPIGTKGARITSYVSLPGRLLVFMPTVDHIGVSRKIESSEERARLRQLIQNNRKIGGGYIVRTAVIGKDDEAILADMRFLENQWTEIRRKAESSRPPQSSTVISVSCSSSFGTCFHSSSALSASIPKSCMAKSWTS